MRCACSLVVFVLAGGNMLAQAPSGDTSPSTVPPPAPGVKSPPPVQDHLDSFKPEEVRLAWSNRRWQLMAGTEVLKDFGYRETEARQALRLIQTLRLNQHGTVGEPWPVMEYWLVDGHAPETVGGGLRALPLDPAGLRVEQIQGQWTLRDSQRVLFNFGGQADQARQALDVVRKYGFTQIGVIGQGTPSMQVFFDRPGGTAGLSAADAASSGRHLTVPHFPRGHGASEETTSQGTPAALAKNTQGLVTPAVGALASQANDTNAGHGVGQHASEWRGQPHFGPHSPLGTRTSVTAERIPFDWRQVQLKQENAGWLLAAGSLVLANFGTNEHDARVALSAMRHYRFTEQWRMGGGDKPTFSYFLINGQAPRGVMVGVNAQMIQPENLSVRQVGGNYALCAGEQVVVRLGQRPDEARRLLQVIQNNKIDRLCRLGEADAPGMTFLARSH
jgi:hypothetical protein